MENQYDGLAMQALLNCRNELYSLFPFLDGAFACLGLQIWDRPAFGTQGRDFLFQPEAVIRLYSRQPQRLRRGYLHTLLHLLYLHPYTGAGRDREKWNLACDLAVEQILQKENCSRLALPEDSVRQACFRFLGNIPLSAQEIYEKLNDLPAAEAQAAEAFRFDDHSLWENPAAGSEDTWKRVLAYGAGRAAGGGHAGSQAGGEEERLADIRAGIGDYRQYLRRFTRAQEEMELDMDSFDYIYYNLGMERYGNLPLLEPLEYREGQKLRQLVIAIDTSGSCDREILRRFLEETYRILSDRENFFRKMEVWLIQCDCLVQSVAVIHSREEWMHYSRSITVQGRGGTDFTPVFRYVDRQRSLGKLRDLGALLYFTDGDGCYPRVRPAYETAFVFVKRTELMGQVPPWAAKLLVQEECR